MHPLIVAAATLLAAAPMAAADQSAPNRNCDLPAPPRNAGLNGLHGEFLFVFPADIPAGYSGCQIVWDELGRQSILLHYTERELKYLAFDPANVTSGKVECFYEDRRFASGDKSCPAYIDAEHGFGALPADAEKIPPERDLRLKSNFYGTP